MSAETPAAAAILALFLAMGSAEAIRHARRFPVRRLWLWIGPATVLVMFALNGLVDVLIPPERIRRHALVDAGSWGIVPSVVLGVLAVSFVDCWFHRAEHRFDALWRIHHQANVHASNYSNLPVWDLLFGTFRDPDRFEGRVGFTRGRGRRILEIDQFSPIPPINAFPAAVKRSSHGGAS